MDGLKMKYFVLKPEGNDTYALASREAMRKYASIVATENLTLSEDLIKWANKEKVIAKQSITAQIMDSFSPEEELEVEWAEKSKLLDEPDINLVEL